MNKRDLIICIATQTSLSLKESTDALNAVISTLTKSMKQGDSVQLVGFGTFLVRNRVERRGRNPQTGENIIIPASKVPAFKAGKALKDSINS